MIQKQTNLTVIDNSGIQKSKCIHVYKKPFAKIGDFILVTITQTKKKKISKLNLLKGSLFKALVIRTKYTNKNTMSNYLQFNENSVILLNKQNQPLGTRIFGPVPLSLRYINQFKIISLGAKLV